MKITTVLAAFASSSLIATGAFAQTMQPIPNPPETEHPAHHVMHHHVHHHASITSTTPSRASRWAANRRAAPPPKRPEGDQHPK